MGDIIGKHSNFRGINSKSDEIFNSFGKVNYEDSFCLCLETDKTFDIDFIIFKIIKTLPRWLKFLLSLRNMVVGIFGLKTGKSENVHYNQEKLILKQDQSIGDFFIILKRKKTLNNRIN